MRKPELYWDTLRDAVQRFESGEDPFEIVKGLVGTGVTFKQLTGMSRRGYREQAELDRMYERNRVLAQAKLDGSKP